MAPTYDDDSNPRKSRAPFSIHREGSISSQSGSDQSLKAYRRLKFSQRHVFNSKQGSVADESLPMTTSKLANQLPSAGTVLSVDAKNYGQPVAIEDTKMNLFAQHEPLNQHVLGRSNNNITQSAASASKPLLIPSTVNTALCNPPNVARSSSNAQERPRIDENVSVADLKKELEEANKKIEGLSQQLTQQQTTKQSPEQFSSPSEHVLAQTSGNLGNPESVLGKSRLSKDVKILPDDDTCNNTSSLKHNYDICSNPWDGPVDIPSTKNDNAGSNGWLASGPPAWNGPSSNAMLNHVHAGSVSSTSRAGSGVSLPPHAFRNGWNPACAPSAASSSSFTPPLTPYEHPQISSASQWQPRAAAAPFDPAGGDLSAPWNNYPGQCNQMPQAQYMPPVEPINYRRLLDRNVSCNWKYIVDKIICSNDQQASIFLQQKLKVSPPELKFELVESIIAQAYPLMVNRFGNFLIQRCLEHGTVEQVNAVAGTIRGKTLELSMDAFGCHVVQKALDVVPETYKASMVHELLRQIPQTVVHRYACHVWQKLFELRWTDSPPQIMRYVNEALRGMWHEVALGETGSLVVQNIFENCLDEDKRPCVTEVLREIDLVAHGQFGNWCIQHICEHGAPADKSRAVEYVVQNATPYSTDQFASKVVEKCLKVGGPDFLERYLEKVCEARPDRPRMPLIDIAGDQYGNYLIQYILLHSDPQHCETVAQHIRKHMVSLRGSKFGSRVALLCCNPAIATRPGPPTAFADRFYQPYNGPVGRTTMPGPCR